MKVHSKLSFFALYLMSELYALTASDISGLASALQAAANAAQGGYLPQAQAQGLAQAQASTDRNTADNKRSQESKKKQHQQAQQHQQSMEQLGKTLSNMDQQRKQALSNSMHRYQKRRYQAQGGSQLSKPATVNQNSGKDARQKTQMPYSKNSQGTKRPDFQSIRAQTPIDIYRLKTSAPYFSGPQIKQKSSSGSQDISAQKLGTNSKRQSKPGASKNTQSTQKASGKTTIGQKPSSSSKQQSNFDSFDNIQDNQEPSSQTIINQKPGSAPKVQAEPTSSNDTQGAQKPNGQAPGTKTTPTANTPSTGECRKIRDAPKMDIKKVLSSINKVRGELPPLNLNPALVKASILKATQSSKVKNASHSHSKECGFGGKSAIHYTTTAINEDDLLKKFTTDEANISKIKDTKFKAFGAAKVGTKWILTFGEE